MRRLLNNMDTFELTVDWFKLGDCAIEWDTFVFEARA